MNWPLQISIFKRAAVLDNCGLLKRPVGVFIAGFAATSITSVDLFGGAPIVVSRVPVLIVAAGAAAALVVAARVGSEPLRLHRLPAGAIAALLACSMLSVHVLQQPVLFWVVIAAVAGACAQGLMAAALRAGNAALSISIAQVDRPLSRIDRLVGAATVPVLLCSVCLRAAIFIAWLMKG